MGRLTIVLTLAIPDRSGSPRMALAYGTRLLSEGYEVVLLHGTRHATGEDSFVPVFEAAGIRTQAISAIDTPVGPLALREMCRALEALEPAAVVSCQVKDAPLAMRAAARMGVPGLHFVQNLRTFSGRLGLAQFKKVNYVHAMRKTDCHLIVNSPALVAQHVETFDIPAERVTLVPNGIDITALHAALVPRPEARAALELAADDIVLMQMGRIGPQKGQDIGIDAFGQFLKTDVAIEERHRYKLLFGGLPGSAGHEQAFFEELKRRVADQGLEKNVRFLGWVDRVTDVLGAADLMLHPARWEGSPLAVLEGLALGLPVAFSDCVGTPDGFVSGKDGFVFRAEDVKACHEALKAALLGTSLTNLQSIGRCGAAYAADNYDVEVYFRDFLACIEAEMKRR